jgi:hypothetical protein
LETSCAWARSGDVPVADFVAISYPSAHQPLLILREAGIIERGRGRLYCIVPAYQPEPGKPLIDLGHCLLRVDRPATP